MEQYSNPQTQGTVPSPFVRPPESDRRRYVVYVLPHGTESRIVRDPNKGDGGALVNHSFVLTSPEYSTVESAWKAMWNARHHHRGMRVLVFEGPAFLMEIFTYGE